MLCACWDHLCGTIQCKTPYIGCLVIWLDVLLSLISRHSHLTLLFVAVCFSFRRAAGSVMSSGSSMWEKPASRFWRETRSAWEFCCKFLQTSAYCGHSVRRTCIRQRLTRRKPNASDTNFYSSQCFVFPPILTLCAHLDSSPCSFSRLPPLSGRRGCWVNNISFPDDAPGSSRVGGPAASFRPSRLGGATSCFRSSFTSWCWKTQKEIW